jgi:hypothetical protein
MLLTFRRYALDDHVLSDIVDLSTYWARLHNIMVTWILTTLSPEQHEIIQKLMGTANKTWLALKAQFIENH